MPKIFDKVQQTKPRMSAFDLSREQKLSCVMGDLVPTYLEEIVPGDQFRVKSEIMMRLAPMIAPVMHRVDVYMHYFFVPNRLVWDQWEDFITGGQQGTSNPTLPTFNLSDLNVALADYLGLPKIPAGTSDPAVSQLPFRAYNLIWNEYYRDETLQNEVDIHAGQVLDLRNMRKRCWEKDYFTSALSFTQRGADISVPQTLKNPAEITSDGALGVSENIEMDQQGGATRWLDTATAGDHPLIIDAVEGIDINDLRRSTALQRFLEKQARGGYRYIETILSHFGVRSSDSRLQRPEYLGGGKQNVMISEVLNTSSTATEPQGNMAGHGISHSETNTFQAQFEEHGYVIGIMSVLPRTAYQQGVHRHWLRDDKFDFYWPDFAHLGEQEVQNLEIYYDPNDDAYNNGVFGYQQRYGEYKYGCSTVHADFKSSLDFWHMGRIFGSQPALNASFVQSNPTDRIFATTSDDTLWVQIYHNVKARRPMPYFADPRLS